MAITKRSATIGEHLTAVPRDRYAELLVVVVTAIALIVAWGVKAGAESRAVHITIESFAASYSHNWIREESFSPEILRIVDPASGARFPTTIVVITAQGGGDAEQIIHALNQDRALKKEMYQSLRSTAVRLQAWDAYRSEFAYVYASPDLLNPTVPVVVHGVDYILPQGGFVVTCLADESVYDEAMADLDRFLSSIALD
jgi:hypothetical protein